MNYCRTSIVVCVLQISVMVIRNGNKMLVLLQVIFVSHFFLLTKCEGTAGQECFPLPNPDFHVFLGLPLFKNPEDGCFQLLKKLEGGFQLLKILERGFSAPQKTQSGSSAS